MISALIIISVIIVIVPVVNFFIKLRRSKIRNDALEDRMNRLRDRYNGMDMYDDTNEDDDDDELKKIDKI